MPGESQEREYPERIWLTKSFSFGAWRAQDYAGEAGKTGGPYVPVSEHTEILKGLAETFEGKAEHCHARGNDDGRVAYNVAASIVRSHLEGEES